MSTHTVDFSDFHAGSLKNMIGNHVQGVCEIPHGLIFSRSRPKHGQLLFTKRDRFECVIDLTQAHVGGIDSEGPYLAAPCYDPDADGSVLKFYNIPSKSAVREYDLPHRAYAVGITLQEMAHDRTIYLVAVVSRADGQIINWYAWGPNTLSLDHLNTTEMNAKCAARNNIVLRRTTGGIFLYAMRAHLFKGTITAYPVHVDQMPTRIDLGDARYRFTHRYLRCTTRFGATLIQKSPSGLHWLRTERNIFNDTLTYRLDDVKWERI